MSKLRDRFEEEYWNAHKGKYATLSRQEMFKRFYDGNDYWYDLVEKAWQGFQLCFKALQEPDEKVSEAVDKEWDSQCEHGKYRPYDLIAVFLNEWGGE